MLIFLSLLSASIGGWYYLSVNTDAFFSWQTLFWVTMFSNSFIAIPHEPLFIEMGKSESLLALLTLAVIPTLMGCMLDYLILKPIIELKKFSAIRQNKTLLKYERQFLRMPGALIILFAVSPLPFYVVRILSLVTDYPFWKYGIFSLAGRLPRYAILSVFGFSLQPPTWTMLLLFLLMILFPLANKYFKLK